MQPRTLPLISTAQPALQVTLQPFQALGQAATQAAQADAASAAAPALPAWHSSIAGGPSYAAGLHSTEEHAHSKRTWPGMRTDQLLHEKTGISADAPMVPQRANLGACDQLSYEFTGITGAEGSPRMQLTSAQRHRTAVASGNISTLAFMGVALVNTVSGMQGTMIP